MSFSQLKASDDLGTVSAHNHFQGSFDIKAEHGDWELWNCKVSGRVPPLGTKLMYAAGAQSATPVFRRGDLKTILFLLHVFGKSMLVQFHRCNARLAWRAGSWK